VHVQDMHASMRSSAHVVRDKLGDYSTLLGSQHVCTIVLVSAECVAPGRLHSGETENGMSGALGFLPRARR
jgi:hypothetical protein